jgi:hypothetical protein
MKKMNWNIPRVLWYVLGISALISCAPVYAQSDPINSDAISGYGLRNLQNAVIIRASPGTPSAGDTVHFTVEGPIYDLPKDSITWNVNGKQLASGIGATSVDTSVDAKSDPLDVSVTVTDPVWGIASNELTLVPLQLDILYDAPTYVPPFYRGRTLPSAGGTLRLQAIARFMQNGTLIPNSSITYTWSRNGEVMGNLSGIGQSQISIDSPPLYGTDTISVRATAKNETLSASASVVIPNTSPVLALYEDHPLFGVTYFSALSGQIAASGEMTVAAIPYFAPTVSLNDPTLEFNWLLNDAELSASSTKRNEITLTADQNSAKVHLDVTSTNNFFLNAASDWTFDFGNSGGSSITKPGSTDAFHNSQL